jgi:Domain of unknown function (DUF4265)
VTEISQGPRAKLKPIAALTKVRFELPEEDVGGTETLWAEPLGDGRYRIDNIPMHVFGISLNDVVAASERDGFLMFDGVVKRGGHSTYRVMVNEGARAKNVSDYRKRLADLGCDFETFTKRYVGIDCPPTSDIHAVYRLIEEAQQNGLWLFDEAHCGHPAVRSN